MVVGQPRVARRGVVERAVRLHVAQRHARVGGERRDRPDLVDDRRLELGRRHVEVAPPEPDEVRVAGMSAHGDAGGRREPDRPLDRQRVAGMGAAGDVDARDERDERLVVAHRPRPQALTDVRVQVDSHGRPSFDVRRVRAAGIVRAPPALRTAGPSAVVAVSGWAEGLGSVSVPAAPWAPGSGSRSVAQTARPTPRRTRPPTVAGRGPRRCPTPTDPASGSRTTGSGRSRRARGAGCTTARAAVPWQPWPSTMPHELPYGLNAPL